LAVRRRGRLMPDNSLASGRAKPRPGEPFAPATLGRQLLDALDAAPDLSDSDKRLLVKLLRLAGERTWCRATAEWLAATLGKSRRSVFYGLGRLAERGLIIRSAQGCRGTVFRFVWSPEYERFQQLRAESVQELAPFVEECKKLHTNSARSCTEIVQEVAPITGITGITGTTKRARVKESEPESDGFDASDTFERLWSRHPKKAGRYLAEQALAEALAEAPEPAALAARIDQVHAAWCASEDWMKQSGRFAPQLHRWLIERRWLDGEPQAPADEEPVIPYRPYWETEEAERNA
jgi:predicted transcriptional regulator